MKTLVFAAVIGGLGIQHFLTNGVNPPSISSPSITLLASGKFSLCNGRALQYCVIDGDTIRYGGVKIRLLDIDAPEISEPKCDSEKALGERAKFRLLAILNSGSVALIASGGRDEDRYRRKLRRVTVAGRPVGDMLISEGLASPWEGHHHDWCGQ